MHMLLQVHALVRLTDVVITLVYIAEETAHGPVWLRALPIVSKDADLVTVPDAKLVAGLEPKRTRKKVLQKYFDGFLCRVVNIAPSELLYSDLYEHCKYEFKTWFFVSASQRTAEAVFRQCTTKQSQ